MSDGGACATASAGAQEARSPQELLRDMREAVGRLGRVHCGVDLGSSGGDRGVVVIISRRLGRRLMVEQIVKKALTQAALTGMAMWQTGALDGLLVPARRHKRRSNQTAAYHRRVQKKWSKRYGMVDPLFLIDQRAVFGDVPLWPRPAFRGERGGLSDGTGRWPNPPAGRLGREPRYRGPGDA